jgi:hypothetical protein
VSNLDPSATYHFRVISVDASGNEAVSGDDTFTTASSPPLDTTDPTVYITSPTWRSTYATQEGTLMLGGTASDNVAVTSITWANNRGGSGTALGTTDWTIPDFSLQSGDDNVITVTATDAAGNSATDTLTVDVRPSPVSGFGIQ